MNVLVCDDDAAARFVASRWLTRTLGCTVTTCEDGVEALKLLAEARFDLAIVDLDLPRLNGVEVVEAIRASDETRDLPIVILSQERRESVIRTLMALGVSAYLLKPLRERAVLGRIAPILATRRPTRSRGTNGVSRLGPDAPALLVDGDQNFRHTFASVAGEFGSVLVADSGADAVPLFRQRPVGLVFVGASLGLVGAEALVKKIRESAPTPVRVVGVGVADTDGHRALFDDVMARGFVVDALRTALQPFVMARGPLADLEQFAPQFEQCLTSALVQVLGMMGGLEVSVGTPPASAPNDGLVTVVTVDVDGRHELDLALAFPGPVVRELSTRLLGLDPADVDQEAEASTACEVTNMVSGRLDAWIKGRSLTSHFTLPVARAAVPDDWSGGETPGESVAVWFDLPEIGHALRLSWRARAHATKAA